MEVVSCPCIVGYLCHVPVIGGVMSLYCRLLVSCPCYRWCYVPVL